MRPLIEVITKLFPGAELETTERLTGGVSADVHRLDLKLRGGDRRSIVLRSHGETHSGHIAPLEYQLLYALHQAGLPVPEPLLVDTSGSLLPDPFLIMDFVLGNSRIPVGEEEQYIEVMAQALGRIHSSTIADLPVLPARIDPLPEVFDYLPAGPEWEDVVAHLQTLSDTAYTGTPKLLHGDFWPENLLWKQRSIVAILDWEDAAIGDPLSDVAIAAVELRYLFGTRGMEQFTRAYAGKDQLDLERLALWQIYVAAAAQKFMGTWGLPPQRESHMRREALASIRDAADILMG